TITDLGFADVSEEWGEVFMRQCRTDGVRVYSADRYSYVCVRASAEGELLGSARREGYVAAGPRARSWAGLGAAGSAPASGRWGWAPAWAPRAARSPALPEVDTLPV